MWRYLNMFVLIGVALIGISLIDLAMGGRFLVEPGAVPNRASWLIYLGAGVLMLINGAVSIRFMPPQPVKNTKTPPSDEAPRAVRAESEA